MSFGEEKTKLAVGIWDRIRRARVRDIAKLVGLVLFFFASVAYWENRSEVYTEVNMTLGRFGVDKIPENISQKSKDNIKSIVDREATVVAAQLVNINFKKNEKQPIYFYSDIAAFGIAMDSYMSSQVSNSPLFVTGDDSNNERIVKIINGDFVCVPLPHRLVALVPLAAKVATAVCSISVPPYYGQIVGYANIWIDHMPTPDEIPNYRAIARTMSVDIYERDVRGK